MPRDERGKFALKNDEHRSVRSLRLTDTTWTALGEMAESLSLTRADLIETMFRNPSNFAGSALATEKHPQPSNTWMGEKDPPSNTWMGDELERLQAEVAHLRQENTFLTEQLAGQQTPMPELEALRERYLKALKLGKQASAYKTAKSAIDQFIQLLQEQSLRPNRHSAD